MRRHRFIYCVPYHVAVFDVRIGPLMIYAEAGTYGDYAMLYLGHFGFTVGHPRWHHPWLDKR